MGQGKSIRLDRFLAEMKQGTRSQVKEMIAKGGFWSMEPSAASLTGKYSRTKPGLHWMDSRLAGQTRNIIC